VVPAAATAAPITCVAIVALVFSAFVADIGVLQGIAAILATEIAAGLVASFVLAATRTDDRSVDCVAVDAAECATPISDGSCNDEKQQQRHQTFGRYATEHFHHLLSSG